MRRVPIGFKLAGALAAPLLGLLAVTVIEVAQTSRAVDEVRSQTDLATAPIGPEGITTGLQDERNWAVAELIGAENALTLPVTGYEETREQTDAAIDDFRADVVAKRGEIARAYQPALAGLDELEGLRDDLDGNRYPRNLNNAPFADGIFDRYAELISPFLDANSRVTVAIDNPELRTGAELIDASSRQIELLASLARMLLTSTLSNGLDQREELADAAALRDAFDRNAQTMQATERQPFRALVASNFPEAITNDMLRVADVAISGGTFDADTVLDALDAPEEESYLGFRDQVAGALQREADDLTASADSEKWLFTGLAAAVLLVALVAMWLVSLSITQPLRSLTRQATDMANQRLPDAVLDILDTPLGDDVTVPHVDPVRVRTRDEVADVADALNTVQDSALDLAVEQAVLRRNISDSFVNLGRRNQNLLGRQLDFITELEHNETDPDTLSNLFRLDHLATRMRRNAESLLVLAGIDPPRKWAAPVRITDAIRAALGEVEDYQRVTVRAVEPITIMGSAAADLAHLLAELIENALIFSPPDQTVEIRGRTQSGPTSAHPAEASAGRPISPRGHSYTLAIIDSGLGMPPDELARANRRLAGAESFTIAPSKYLGHYVAGNLAARHNINVQLHNSPGHGITATINIPPTLLTAEQQFPPDTGDTSPAAIADAAPGAPELRAAPDTKPTPAAATATSSPTAPSEPAVATPEPVGAAAGPTAAPMQTTSGLAKRSRAGGRGGPTAIPTQPGRTRPATPSDDLIQTLARHTSGLQQGPPSPGPAPSSRAPSSPPPPLPQRPAAAPTPPAPPPPAPPPPSEPPPAPQAPRSPEPPPRLAPEPGPLAGLQSWADRPTDSQPPESPPRPPLTPRDPQREGPRTRPRRAPFPPEQPPSRGPTTPRGGFAPPVARSEPPLVPLDNGGPGRNGGLDHGGPPPGPDQAPPPTSGGLTRRVRGAQMPTTEPRAMRRNHGNPQRPRPRDEPGHRPGSPPTSQPSDTNGDHKAADDVYSFLSSFTAGVQRGLDESGKPTAGSGSDEPNDAGD